MAGEIIEVFKKQLIRDNYKKCLATASIDCEKETNTTVLIQKFLKLTELHKILETSNDKGRERSNWTEMSSGKKKYDDFLLDGELNGMTHAVLYSLLVGDYSLHSSNVALLDSSLYNGERWVTKIDFGAAFRFYDKNDNNNPLYPAEYKGIKGAIKKVYKDYLRYYIGTDGFLQMLGETATSYLDAFRAQRVPLEIGIENALIKIFSVIKPGVDELKDIYKLTGIDLTKASLHPDNDSFEENAMIIYQTMLTRLHSLASLNDPILQKKSLEQLESTKRPAKLFRSNSYEGNPLNPDTSSPILDRDFKRYVILSIETYLDNEQRTYEHYGVAGKNGKRRATALLNRVKGADSTDNVKQAISNYFNGRLKDEDGNISGSIGTKYTSYVSFLLGHLLTVERAAEYYPDINWDDVREQSYFQKMMKKPAEGTLINDAIKSFSRDVI
ncbi:hypothetical protein N474_22085 [Pseudoalteromonas luteoviolacea CPMOR-2]|nr:hypothetical protein N474_22085 [Pseudoalteromonas luteoviolacea CPMOR-2]